MKRFVSVYLSLIICGSNLTYSQGIDSFSRIKNSKIYYHQKGNGETAVIFVSGLGEDHSTWQTVQDSISKLALTISYDRAGLGKSQYNGEKKDLGSLANELKSLINSINVSKTFILVGHSLGCQIIKKYVSLFPENIKGIIFLDPGYDEQKLRKRLPDSVWQKREKALKKYMPELNEAQQAELDNLNANCQMADEIISMTNVPVILFTATHTNPDFPGSLMELRVKQETHNLWLLSMPRGKHVEVKGSRHYIQNDIPQIIIEAIGKMIVVI